MSLLSRTTEFIDIACGVTHYRYTTADRPLVYDRHTYRNIDGLKRGKIRESSDLERNALDITAPNDLPLLDLYRGTVPMQPATVTLYALRNGQTVADVIWVGEIGTVEWNSASKAVVHCQPPMAALQGLGLRRNWQKSCPHAVFQQGLGMCNAVKDDFRAPATLDTVTGRQVTSSTFATQADGWFAGGWIEWVSPAGLAERRFVVTHAGNTLTLLTPVLADAGQAVDAFPGCDHTLEGGCTKLNNTINYGGQPWIPVKNPFGVDPMY